MNDALYAPNAEETKATTILGLRLSALFEIALFLGAMLVLDVLIGQGDRFYDISPHPFWALIILIAAQYGTAEALVAAIAASAVLLLGNLPDQSITQDMYDYLLDVFRYPLMWLVTSVLLGELRQRHIRERNQLRTALAESHQRETKISTSYQWVRDAKEKLELRIAGSLRSSIAIYHAVKMMENLSPSEALKGMQEMINNVLHPESYSIYLLENDSLQVTTTHGWPSDDRYKRVFTTTSSLFQSIVAEKKAISVVNADQELTLSGEGVLAGPIIDKETGEVFGMIKIERMNFTELNISNIESFTAMCEWAGMAIVNARKYAMAKQESIINPDHNLFTANYFRRYADYISSLAKRVGFSVTAINIRIANSEALDEDQRISTSRVLARSVDQVLRDIDLAFDYQGTAEDYFVILPATEREGANIVLDKIRKALAQNASPASRMADFSYSVQPLYSHDSNQVAS